MLSERKPLVSVIIPAYNEENYLRTAIQSIRDQTYKRIETIVVSNACSDNTSKVAKELAVTVVETPKKGVSHAKNLGYAASQGDLLAFMDADSIAEENLIEKIVEACSDGVECGKVAIRPLDDSRFRARFFCRYWEIVAKLTNNLKCIDSGTGAFIFMTRALAEKILKTGGTLFSEQHQVMEDIELNTRMKKAGKFKFIQESYLHTSMRRFVEEGYLKCFVEDFLHARNPAGKTRKRWG